MRRNRHQQMNLHPDRELQRLDERYLRTLRQLKTQYLSAWEEKQIDFAVARRDQLYHHQGERDDLASEHISLRRWMREEHAREMRRLRDRHRSHYLRRKEDEARIRQAEERYGYETEFKSKKYALDVRQRTEITVKLEIQQEEEIELWQWHQQAVEQLKEDMFVERNTLMGPWLRS